MSPPTARMMLACKYDGDRWPDDTQMEAVLLHFQVEHDTDRVELDLIVVCACNTAMRLTRTETTVTGYVDHFECPSDGLVTEIARAS